MQGCVKQGAGKACKVLINDVALIGLRVLERRKLDSFSLASGIPYGCCSLFQCMILECKYEVGVVLCKEQHVVESSQPAYVNLLRVVSLHLQPL